MRLYQGEGRAQVHPATPVSVEDSVRPSDILLSGSLKEEAALNFRALGHTLYKSEEIGSLMCIY